MKGLLVLVVIAVMFFFAFRSDRSSEQPAPVVATSDSEAVEPDSFAGHECTIDCSGHEAGYRWAEENDIDDEDVCDTAAEHSNSPSFGEGCKAYVNGESLGDDDKDPDANDDSS
jgi:hypothetical protein